MSDIYNKIKEIEKHIERIKLLHTLNKISIIEARDKIKNLENELKIALSKLPESEREMYLHKREFGSLDYHI